MTKKCRRMHDAFGSAAGSGCYNCSNLLGICGKDRITFKCRLYDASRAPDTNWQAHYPACGMHNKPIAPGFTPVALKPEHNTDADPIDGQTTLEDFYG